MTELALVVVGLAAGALSATLGIGGGVVFVPALAVIASFEQQLAQGTSLAVIVPTTIIGAVTHARAGRVVWPIAVTVGLAGIAGGLAGAQLALALDATLLRRLFAAFLLLMAARLAVRSLRSSG